MKIDFPKTLFISGIDTDAGKSYATGWLANQIAAQGESVITQKLVQTGCHDMSEDIEIHRRIMGTGLLPADRLHITAPLIFSYPCSPELAARIDNRELNLGLADEATETLLKEYSHVLIEGAGGLMVPLKGDYLAIDYARERELPVVLITNGRLGSINHTLLSMSAISHAGLRLFAVIYNDYFDYDKIIADDTRNYIRHWLEAYFPETLILEMPKL